jgi:hypothetical protein
MVSFASWTEDASVTYILHLKATRASPGIVCLSGTWGLRPNHRHHHNLTLGQSQLWKNVYLRNQNGPGPYGHC